MSQNVVLISIMGNRDPYWEHPENGRIKGAVRQYVQDVYDARNNQHIALSELMPAYLYLLYTDEKALHDFSGKLRTANKSRSSQDQQTRIALLMTELKDDFGIETTPCPMKVADPTDYKTLLKEMGRESEKAFKAHPEARMTVLISPGTKQMQAVWLILANEGRLAAELYQKTDPDNGNRTVKVNYEPLFEIKMVEQASRLFIRFDFDVVATTFKAISVQSTNYFRKQVSHLLIPIMNVYACWEKLQYGEALQELAEAERRLKIQESDGLLNLSGLTQLLFEQKQWLESLNNSKTESRVLDLLCSASRFCNTGKYMDSIWRCRTAYEIMISGTCEDLGIRFDTVDMGVLERKLREADHQGAKALSSMYHKNQEHKEALDYLRGKRNDIVHHGIGCTKDDAENAISIITKSIKIFYKIDRLLAHPMSSLSLAKTGKLFDNLLRRGL